MCLGEGKVIRKEASKQRQEHARRKALMLPHRADAGPGREIRKRATVYVSELPSHFTHTCQRTELLTEAGLCSIWTFCLLVHTLLYVQDRRGLRSEQR